MAKYGLIYPGSKGQQVEDLAELLPKEGKRFYDVFAGGGAVTDYMSRPNSGFDEIVSVEVNPKVQDAVKTALTGKLPKFIQPENLSDFKSMSPLEQWMYSFNGNMRDRVSLPDDRFRARLARLQELNSFKDKRKPIEFVNDSYENLIIPKGEDAVAYFDPPYRNTTGYRVSFDPDIFDKYMLENTPNRSYVSEYTLPSDKYEILSSKDRRSTIGGKTKHVKELVGTPNKGSLGLLPDTKVSGDALSGHARAGLRKMEYNTQRVEQEKSQQRIAKRTPEIKPITHNYTPFGDFSNSGVEIKENPLLESAVDNVGTALFGDEGENQNFVTGLLPGLDAATKIAEGKTPGVLDLPMLGDIKAIGGLGKKAADLGFAMYGMTKTGQHNLIKDVSDYLSYKLLDESNGGINVDPRSLQSRIDVLPPTAQDVYLRTFLPGVYSGSDTPISITAKSGRTTGGGGPDNQHINIGSDINDDEQVSALIHEPMHVAGYRIGPENTRSGWLYDANGRRYLPSLGDDNVISDAFVNSSLGKFVSNETLPLIPQSSNVESIIDMLKSNGIDPTSHDGKTLMDWFKMTLYSREKQNFDMSSYPNHKDIISQHSPYTYARASSNPDNALGWEAGPQMTEFLSSTQPIQNFITNNYPNSKYEYLKVLNRDQQRLDDIKSGDVLDKLEAFINNQNDRMSMYYIEKYLLPELKLRNQLITGTPENKQMLENISDTFMNTTDRYFK